VSRDKDKGKDKGQGKSRDKRQAAGRAKGGKRRAGREAPPAKSLCKWDKAAYADRDTIGQVVRDAAFACRKCGRAANDPARLCKPLKLVRKPRADSEGEGEGEGQR
jgi:hypothetical protein